MKKYLMIICVLVHWACSAPKEKNADLGEKISERPLKIIGYVAGWRDFSIDSLQANQLTHINYAFANVVEGVVQEGEGLLERDTENLKLLNDLKRYNPSLHILISIGGWSWSGGFSDAALTNQSRELFANSAIDYLLRHQLDGVDIDWEYPGLPGNDNTYRAEDRENFVALLKRVREKLDSLATQQGRGYLLTIASAGFDEYVEVNNLGEAQQFLDFINIMTYDFTGEWNDSTGHHANLYAINQKSRSADNAVKKHVEAGVPIGKLVLGIPFYGRSWVNVKEGGKGLHQPGEGHKSYGYKEIKVLLDSGEYTVHWDSLASVPFIWHEKKRQFITFENLQSIQVKADYILKQGLGGAMFWEFTEDDGALLDRLYKQLK